MPPASSLFEHVGGVEHRLGGQEVEGAIGGAFLVGGLHTSGPACRRRARPGARVEQPSLQLGLGIARLGGARGLVEPLFHDGEVGEPQLDVDDLAVAGRVDRTHHVLDVGILEAADHVHDRVHLADVGEELVAEALALARALDQAGDVEELDRRGHGALGLHDPGERVEPRVGDLHDAGVRFDRGEGIVRHQRAGGGERVEEGGLADVGKADDAEAEHRPIGERGTGNWQWDYGRRRLWADSAAPLSHFSLLTSHLSHWSPFPVRSSC